MVHKERCLKCQKDFEVKYLSSIPDFILLVQKSNLKLPCFIYSTLMSVFQFLSLKKKQTGTTKTLPNPYGTNSKSIFSYRQKNVDYLLSWSTVQQ